MRLGRKGRIDIDELHFAGDGRIVGEHPEHVEIVAGDQLIRTALSPGMVEFRFRAVANVVD